MNRIEDVPREAGCIKIPKSFKDYGEVEDQTLVECLLMSHVVVEVKQSRHKADED